MISTPIEERAMSNRAKLSIMPQNNLTPSHLNTWEQRDLVAEKKEKLIYLDPRDVNRSEHDPRESLNEKEQQELVESIRVSGLKSVLKIHRKDANSAWSVQAGGNRRLRALQELANEGHQPCLLVGFVSVPYQEDIKTMFSHLIENAERLDLTFWEQTTEMFKIKSALESTSNRKLGISDFLKLMKQNACGISEALFHVRSFAQKNLDNLSDSHKQKLTLTAVQAIKAEMNLILSFLEFSPAKPQKDLVMKQAFDDFNQTTDDIRQSLVKHTKERVAHSLKVSRETLEYMLKAFDPKKEEQLQYTALLQAAQRHEHQKNMKQEVFTIDLNKDKRDEKLNQLLLLEEGRPIKIQLVLDEQNKQILKQLLKI